jgi:hypothetical protein
VRYKGHIRHFGHQTMGRSCVFEARSALLTELSLTRRIWNRVARLGRRCGTQVFRGKVCSGQ